MKPRAHKRQAESGRAGEDRARPPGQRGFSLLELLVSMSLLVMITLSLAELFAFTAEVWARQTEGMGAQLDLKEVSGVLRRDLEACFTGRPASWVTADPREMMPPGASKSVQRLFSRVFQERMLLPVEVDRKSGTDERVSLPHADRGGEDGRPSFSTLAFAAVEPEAGLLHPASLAQERCGKLAPGGEAPVVPAGICLIGYYVAYTADTPFAPESHWSMKLFRHCRPGGISLGDAQAGGILRAMGEAVNHPRIPRTKRANRDLQHFFAWSMGPDSGFTRVKAERPWPLGGDYRPAGAVPPRDNLPLWMDPESALHDSLPPDAPLVGNVVRFEVRPSKWIDVGGRRERMDTERLTAFLRLPDPDWPVLVAPDEVEVVLSVISAEAAAKLTRREDWLVRWKEDQMEGPETVAWRVIRRSVCTSRIRVVLKSAP